jgi:hypothetical protein
VTPVAGHVLPNVHPLSTSFVAVLAGERDRQPSTQELGPHKHGNFSPYVSGDPFHLRRDPLQHCISELLQASGLTDPPLFHEGKKSRFREQHATLPRIADRRAHCCSREPEEQWYHDKCRSPICLSNLEEAAVQFDLILLHLLEHNLGHLFQDFAIAKSECNP